MHSFETQNWKTAIPVDSYKQIPPDPRIVDAFQNIGYSLEAALADLVDNSADAGATLVLIRFLRTSDDLQTLIIADNGRGMAPSELDRAMKFGGKRQYKPGELGMYGMGLKSASLSQADTMTVLTKARGHSPAGRQWRAARARANWRCDVIGGKVAAEELGRDWHPELGLAVSGTIVRWDDVRDFRKASNRVDVYLQKARRSITNHLGLQFHRFLSGAKARLRIIIDTANVETSELSPQTIIVPLDPFSYTRSGDKNYPKRFRLKLGSGSEIHANAHIWPPRTSAEGYKLGGGAVARRQGFYFYRNDRLLQAGGWNQFREDTEPHLSLARVSIDLPPSLDTFFNVRFNKLAVDAPRSFADSLDGARAADGTTFREYIERAATVYRTKAERALPAVFAPGRGLRAAVEAAVRASRDVIPRHQVDILWAPLPRNEFFRIDRNNDRVILNALFRKTLLAGRAASASDAPVLKTLLYLLTEELFHTERQSGLERLRLEAFQSALIAALKEEAT